MTAQRLSNVEFSHYLENVDSGIRTTVSYTHVLNRRGNGVISPADDLPGACYAETI
jgi:hypothetical protein